MQCIIPPHMVEAIEMRGSPEQREMVRQLQAEADEFRTLRQELAPPQAFAGVEAAPAGVGEEADQEVYDAGSLADLPGQFRRRTGEPDSDDESVNDAFNGTATTWQFLRTVYERNSLDGQGLRLISSVHYRRNYNNAAWNGTQMLYGDGDGVIFKPLAKSLSVVAHELTHGVVQYSGGLVYRDQSGALNEHCADVFGCLTEQYARGQAAHEADWLIGQGILGDDIQGVALRSMKAPGTAYDDDLLGPDPQPYHMDYYVTTTADRGGVHINSGIPNHAFYLLAQLLGGNAWERAGRIWYDTLQAISNPYATFSDWAGKTVEVAGARFGAGGSEQLFTRRAWKLVGITV